MKCFRTKLFELEDEVIQLKLPEDSEKEKTMTSKVKGGNANNKIHGKWIIVNGNSTHIESKELIEACKLM